MTERKVSVERNTLETQVKVSINLDGTGEGRFDIGVPFMEHMLDQIARHGLIDLDIHCNGDLHIDDHHTVEDVGITLGQAFAKAIGDKKGIRRMGHAIVPMDDSVATVAIDISGRSYCNMGLDFKHDKIGDLSSDVVVHFFESFASSGKINVYGTCKGANDHHKAEALFKAFAKSLYDGCKIEHDEILSTKGVL